MHGFNKTRRIETPSEKAARLGGYASSIHEFEHKTSRIEKAKENFRRPPYYMRNKECQTKNNIMNTSNCNGILSNDSLEENGPSSFGKK